MGLLVWQRCRKNGIAVHQPKRFFLARCVASGPGIALMLSYMMVTEFDLVPLQIDLTFKTKLFASYHRERASRTPVKATLSFLKTEVFDPKAMPWFGDEFVWPAPEWRQLGHSMIDAQPPLRVLRA